MRLEFTGRDRKTGPKLDQRERKISGGPKIKKRERFLMNLTRWR
jgi:hypothetical protein